MKKHLPNRRTSVTQGFTLIELLVVIAVLGILSAIVLVAINPLEQFSRGRDSSRKTLVGQLGRAAQAFFTSHVAQYPNTTGSSWVEGLTQSGEIKSVPASVAYLNGAACTTNVENGLCYVFGNPNGAGTSTEAIIYSRLESGLETSKCTAAAGGSVAYFVWSSQDGRAGVLCRNVEPVLQAGPFGAGGTGYISPGS